LCTSSALRLFAVLVAHHNRETVDWKSAELIRILLYGIPTIRRTQFSLHFATEFLRRRVPWFYRLRRLSQNLPILQRQQPASSGLLVVGHPTMRRAGSCPSQFLRNVGSCYSEEPATEGFV